MKIFFVGMPGSGKSTIAKKLSDILGFKIFDIDKIIEEKENISIKDMFFKYGERYFRKLEKETLFNLKEENSIIATGGGIILDSENRDYMKKNKTIFLYVEPNKLFERINDDSRPLLVGNKEKIFDLWQERKKFYNIFEKVDISCLSIDETIAQIMYKIVPAEKFYMKNNFQNITFVTQGFKHIEESKIVFLSESVNRIYGEKIKNEIIILPDGEKVKSVDCLNKIYDVFLDKNISRNDYISAIGGGTITDVLSYAASTFKRGLKYKLFPTTLLAQIDAAIGGKTGINYRGIKNIIGNFSLPNETIIDVLSIYSLSDDLYYDGIIEALKMFLIKGETFDYFINNIDLLKKRNFEFLKSMINYCIESKLEIVSQDFNDLGKRNILNIGHTFGHAFESLTNFSHGKAVAWGILKEIEFLEKNLNLKFDYYDKIYYFIKEIIPKDVFDKKINPQIFMEKLTKDKKSQKNNFVMIPFIKNVGEHNFTKIEYEKIFNWIKSEGGIS